MPEDDLYRRLGELERRIEASERRNEEALREALRRVAENNSAEIAAVVAHKTASIDTTLRGMWEVIAKHLTKAEILELILDTCTGLMRGVGIQVSRTAHTEPTERDEKTKARMSGFLRGPERAQKLELRVYAVLGLAGALLSGALLPVIGRLLGFK